MRIRDYRATLLHLSGIDLAFTYRHQGLESKLTAADWAHVVKPTSGLRTHGWTIFYVASIRL